MVSHPLMPVLQLSPVYPVFRIPTVEAGELQLDGGTSASTHAESQAPQLCMAHGGHSHLFVWHCQGREHAHAQVCFSTLNSRGQSDRVVKKLRSILLIPLSSLNLNLFRSRGRTHSPLMVLLLPKNDRVRAHYLTLPCGMFS